MSETLTIGATGRRHIVRSALGRVEASTRRALRLIFDEVGERGVEVVVATGLAIGADSLIARVALEERARTSGGRVRLRAVLPMPREEYAFDFRAAPRDEETVAERNSFLRLLELCDEVVELPILSRRADGTFSRSAQYAALGDYLVRESEILFSFWNGDASVAKPGGTVDVTLQKLRAIESGQASSVLVLSAPEERRVRQGDGRKILVPENDETAGELAFLTSLPAANVDFSSRAPLDELRAFLATKLG